jgi:hypothetical protein
MIKKLRHFFSKKTIKWVVNTQVLRKHLEAESYLLVDSVHGSMLFTPAQVRAAEKRAAKHPEDCK